MTLTIIAIVAVALWLVLSVAVGDFADKRGRRGTLWYLFGIFFSPLIGFAFVAALPPPVASHRSVADKQCTHCSAKVKAEAEICPFCHSDLVGKGKIEELAA